MKTRIEHDSLGAKEIPDSAYYGSETVRAIENYPISGLKFHCAFIWATAAIKKAAAQVNSDLKRLDSKIAEAIIGASEEVMAGKFQNVPQRVSDRRLPGVRHAQWAGRVRADKFNLNLRAFSLIGTSEIIFLI